jgi:4-hydroxybenzoyl-CoA thioesterase
MKNRKVKKMKNVYPFKVVWGDTDAAGIVFYPNFYRWMDQASHELLRAAGFPIAKLQDENIITPLLEAFCQFKSPLMYDDEVAVHSEVAEVHNKVFKIKHTFKKGDVIVAEGHEIRAWTSVAEERPKAVPVPENVKSVLLGE